MPPAAFAAAFRVRTATPSDATQIGEVLNASYPKLMRDHYSEEVLEVALPLMTQANPKLLATDRFYLAETAGTEAEGGARRVVGCGGWTHERPGQDGEVVDGLAHIRHFGVHPDFGRRGVGRAIFDECAARARGEGVVEFECWSSLNGAGFYSALGFRHVGPVDVPMGPGVVFPALIMRCLIVRCDLT